mmetsp:Transcript_16929/g.33041  ORF Transcript_16929/g.33041 Transcript_16929/m.33041 type:complete len:118 (-) Transcript_16929:607-960(-)
MPRPRGSFWARTRGMRRQPTTSGPVDAAALRIDVLRRGTQAPRKANPKLELFWSAADEEDEDTDAEVGAEDQGPEGRVPRQRFIRSQGEEEPGAAASEERGLRKKALEVPALVILGT